MLLWNAQTKTDPSTTFYFLASSQFYRKYIHLNSIKPDMFIYQNIRIIGPVYWWRVKWKSKFTDQFSEQGDKYLFYLFKTG